MKLDSLDLEHKLYQPTQQLYTQLQLFVIGLYNDISLYLVDLHHTVAILSKRWYDSPVATTKEWYRLSADYNADMYAILMDEILPKTELAYQEVLTSANEYRMETLEQLNYMIDNPEQVTAESIEVMTETLTAAGNQSAEWLAELQGKSADIIELLLAQPLETMEAASMELLAGLLNGYFAVVSNMLQIS